MIRLIAFPTAGIRRIAKAKVIEFCIPKSFRKPMKWVAVLERGQVIEFCPRTKKLA